MDQLVVLSRNSANLARFTYDERGNISAIIHANGTYTAYEYNDANQLKSLKNFDANGNVLNYFLYSYDANGNITAVETKDGTITYEYDALNQLTKETLADGTAITYEYDAVGNRTKKIVNNGTTTTTTYTYDAADQLTAVNGQAYTYDVNGNLTNNGNKTFVYDDENRLIQVKNASGTTIATYTYDHQGRRISKTTSSGTTYYHYDGDSIRLLYETDANNNITAEYTWDALGRPVTMTKAGATYYYHVNGHGDVVALTDASGNVVAQYEYDAWGNILSKTGAMATANPYRYAGYYYDEETGLYYLMARYYDANMGRFITRDTFHGFENEPLSINQYVYTKNNPVIYVDINGHFAFLLVPLAGVSISWLTAAAVEATAIVIAYVAANEIVSVLERKFNRKNPTVIYRTGSGNGTNLTPRPKDVSGLSYTTVKPLSGPYTATTIEAINATGKLVAIKDGKTHVSVRPVNMKKMQGWINSRENANTRPHEYTKLLQALSVKVK